MSKQMKSRFWLMTAGVGVAVLALLPLMMDSSTRLLAQSEEDDALVAEDSEVTAPAPAECTFFTPSRPSEGVDAESIGTIWNASLASQQTQLVAGLLPDFRSGRGDRTLSTGGPYLSRIDHHIFSLLQAKNIPPASLTTDEEFLRRVTMDLTGRIPLAADVTSFLADSTVEKRSNKIDQLLNSPEWVDRWTMWLGDLVKNNVRNTQITRGALARDASYQYIRESVAANKPYNQFVSEMIQGLGDNEKMGPPNWIVGGFMSMGPAQDTYDRQLVQTATTFLGMRYFDCVLCHDGAGHLDDVNLWGAQTTRRQVWGMAAFFSRARMTRQVAPATNYVVTEVATGNYLLNTNSGNRPDRAPIRAGAATILQGVNNISPTYLFSGRTYANTAAVNYRARLAEEITGDLQFSRATVNYLWAHFFGVGIVDPPDGFDPARLDPKNPPPAPWTIQPSHPELLDELARGFINMNYDLKAMQREITNSQAYQLSSRYTGEWNPNWARYQARHLVRRLDAEELVDALVLSSNVPNPMVVPNYPNPIQWAMQLPDTTVGGGTVAFLDDFLRGDRDENVRRKELTTTQALSLMNDPFITNRVRAAALTTGRLATLMATIPDNTQLVDAIYLNVLSRRPSSIERNLAMAKFNTGTRTSNAQDLLWALYNKVDFMFNY
ncbi:MAG: DUF1553 domain-containing protein [Acidobacteria bacterium]|nr:DUF1553 domain-containing protein [Acidobacteriota bacterium]